MAVGEFPTKALHSTAAIQGQSRARLSGQSSGQRHRCDVSSSDRVGHIAQRSSFAFMSVRGMQKKVMGRGIKMPLIRDFCNTGATKIENEDVKAK